MGNSESENKDTTGGAAEGEGFFGDPKIRMATIGGLLIALSVLQLPWISESLDNVKDAQDLCESVGSYLGATGSYGGASTPDYQALCDSYDGMISGLSLHLSGLVFILVFSICAILTHFMSCGAQASMFGIVIMIGLVLGGFFTILGHSLWKIDPATGSSSDVVDALLTCYWAENFLGGVTAMVLGYDVWKLALNDQSKRMWAQSLVLLTLVSLCCFIGYAIVGSEIEHEETQLIASGYFFILFACVLYLVFNFQIDNKIQQMMGSIVIGIILIFGSVLAAIGYWGGYTCDFSGCNDLNAYVTGYCILLIGLCVVNALDRGLYDNAKLYQNTPKPT
eukprot:242893_1